ncbi:hypothetical protein DEW08_02085 [Azospirillum thermophilum]|uniref:Uncharacterized protein n=1 Tax=Azospirillum thermophilum TaxID=2202148 RepID=A0A2S2CL22_9PROT|nr:hypothetical protein DEW08_02085 [Azospirillum thermophilum]
MGREGEGADAAAFNAEKKINWAKPFDERKEGYTAVKRVSPGFFRALRGALVSMKGGSAKK